ncbi:hypothetical protein PVAND_006749 [Polypedilum vanderplanki]|uniref:Lebercilin domain-containing protein n=1 Tax=Polypedilum vanderplanki TaxID=319348 RepID=A0A9J6C458_POLVA|nr:hypothetical protein PVAND_006749 [Polypedilum vanderplanki]
MSVVTILPGTTCKNLKTNSNEFNTSTNSMRSIETVYSIPSSKMSVLTRRKFNQKNRERNPTLVPVVSEIKQRVMSARMLRIKQLQNQIGETQHRLSELMTENRTLKALQRRHESALSRHEGPSAELPQLLNSHAEELRMWTTRCRNLQQKNIELQAKLKLKEQIILTVTDQNKQLHQLDKSKNLLERAALQERVKVLEERVTDKEKEIKLLVRRLQLAEKAYKTNLHIEQQKYRDLLTKIEMSELILNTESTNKKISPRVSLQRGSIRNKSPPNRLLSKSATNLSNPTNDQRENSIVVEAPENVLPTNVNNNDFKINESIKFNTPCVVNTNVKLMPDIKADPFDEEINEIDLTKNCIDNSNKTLSKKENEVQPNGHMTKDDDENTINKTKNGMHRARQQNQSKPVVPKLSPLHTTQQQQFVKKSEKKSTSDDSEFSDNEDFHFYSDNNGTKMAQLLKQKMHVAELDIKMKQNSLDSTGSQKNSYQVDDEMSNSSFSSHEAVRNEDLARHHLHHFRQIQKLKDRGDNSDLFKIQRQMHESIIHRETMLDEYCNEIVDQDFLYSEQKFKEKYLAATGNEAGTNKIIQQQPYQIINCNKTNGHVAKGGGQIEKNQLDEKKKAKLLAAMKIIDNNSIEN